MTDPLIERRWYWVRNSPNDEWFPACRMSQAPGGWCNQDTWEDWDHEVTEWRLILLPPEPSLLRRSSHRVRLTKPDGTSWVWLTYAITAANAHWMAAELHPDCQVEVLGLEGQW